MAENVPKELLMMDGGAQLAAQVAMWTNEDPSSFVSELKKATDSEKEYERQLEALSNSWAKKVDRKSDEVDNEMWKGFAEILLGAGGSGGGPFAPVDVGFSIGLHVAKMMEQIKDLKSPTPEFYEMLEISRNPPWRTNTLSESQIRDLVQKTRLDYNPQFPSYEDVTSIYDYSVYDDFYSEFKGRDRFSYAGTSREKPRTCKDDGSMQPYIKASLLNELAGEDKTAVLIQAPYNYDYRFMELFRRYLSFVFDEEDARERQRYADTGEAIHLIRHTTRRDDGYRPEIHDLVICSFGLPKDAGYGHILERLWIADSKEKQNIFGDPSHRAGWHGHIQQPRIWGLGP